jgi:chaperone required for assembly of F1-ATPase
VQRGYREATDKPRRFYKTVDVSEAQGGFTVLLDGRRMRAPKGAALILPTRALADQVAEDWAGQGETLEFAVMHANRLANTALEAVAEAREATAESVANYAASDLLCYYAEGPAGLVERQTALWEPVLARAEAELGLRFVRAVGIVHQAQPQATIDRVRALALDLDDFSLTGLAFGASLFGSAVLAIALHGGWLSGEAAYDLSRLDEAWTEEKWGVDAEAAERTARLRGEAAMLERWFAGLWESAATRP